MAPSETRHNDDQAWFPGFIREGDDQHHGVPFRELYSSALDGTHTWCGDCQKTTPCSPNGAGASAYHRDGIWDCGMGGGGSFVCEDLNECNLCPLITNCTPACVALGESCTSSAQCCEGFCNEDGICAITTPGGCTAQLGEPCTGSGDCCAGFCSGGTCTVPECACIADTQACDNNTDCCSGSCVNGICGCVALGESCTETSDCCEGSCIDGTCSTGGGGGGGDDHFCFTIDPALPDTANVEVWNANHATTLVDVQCYCVGTCDGGSATIAFYTRAGAQIDLDGSVTGQPAITCQFGSTADATYKIFSTSDSDRILPEGRGVLVTPTGVSVDRISGCVRFTQP